MNRRPTCPTCGHPIDRLRHSYGIVGAYPCRHWLTRDQADQVRAEARPQ